MLFLLFFFKQKTAYEMRISDWSSDVCSSDLAVVFAVIAATIIRTFFIEAYTIPTPSMEKSLLVGDFLFVSKLNYGPRVPMTPLAFPFAHHTMPLTRDVKSYSTAIQLPYYRLPGIEDIERKDVVVFNYPADPIDRHVDKRENYIKRYVAIAGH